MTARTEETERAYQQAKIKGDLVSLHEETPIREWKFWKLIPNRFPHDKLNTRHLMVVLKRGSALWELTDAEVLELWRVILPELDDEFHYFKLNGRQLRSVQGVPHIHVCDHLPEFV